MKKFAPAVYVLAILLLFSSCVSHRKINRLNETIKSQKQTEAKVDSTLTSLNNLRVEKSKIGELDDTSSNAIQKIINTQAVATKSRIDSLQEMENKLGGKRVKVKAYKNMVAIVTSGSTIQSERLLVVDFVDNLLKQQTFIKFNTAAFFPPGGYKIGEDKMADAKSFFAPLIDSLITFVNRFPSFNLASSVISCGFADGQGFSPGELVNTLASNIGKADPSNQELNLELSRLRADEISGILLQIFKEKIKTQPASKTMDTRFYKTGKGEEFPNKKITDYQIDDERRRIVVIYWNAIPESK
jgi:hypothetical protein